MADHSTLSTQARSWADLIATIVIHDGETLDDVDINALSVGATRSRGVQMKHGRKYGRTHGSTEFSGSLTFFDSGWVAFRAAVNAVAAAKAVSFFDVAFDIVVKVKPVDSSLVETTKIEGCVIDEASFEWAEGDDPDSFSVTLNVMNVVQIEGGEEVDLG